MQFVEIEDDVLAITAHVQQQLRRTSLNGSMMASMMSLHSDRAPEDHEGASPLTAPRKSLRAQRRSSAHKQGTNPQQRPKVAAPGLAKDDI